MLAGQSPVLTPPRMVIFCATAWASISCAASAGPSGRRVSAATLGAGDAGCALPPLAPVDTAFALTVTNATLSFPSQSAVTFTAATDLPVTSPELSSAAATELFSLDQRTGLPRR